MKNLILTFFLLLSSIRVIADEQRAYSLDKLIINNVDYNQKYIVRVNSISNDGLAIVPYTEFCFHGFTDNGAHVKNITSNGSTLYIEFYRQNTSKAISSSVDIGFYAKTSNTSDEMSYYSLRLPYTYNALTSIDAGVIAGPNKYHIQGERPACIESIYSAIPLVGTTLTYTWEKKQGESNWITIENASSEYLYPDSAGSISDFYRRKATDDAGNNAYSNVVEILPRFSAGKIELSYTDTDNTITLTNISSPNTTDAQISWQFSTNLDIWEPIAGTQASITVDRPTVTTYYRRVVTSHVCDDYGVPIVEYSNLACYYAGTPAAISTHRYWTTTDTITDNTYFDGFGRKSQLVAKAATINGSDIVTTYSYDNNGRECRTGVPFCNDGAGAFVHNALHKGSLFHNDSFATYLKEYDNSPLNRLTNIYRPGATYQSASSRNSTTIRYGMNSSGEALQLKITDKGFSVVGYYPTATLHKITTTNEDCVEVTRFTNPQGLMIMERRSTAEEQFADTYYVYDSKLRLCIVVTPKGSAELTIGMEHSYSSEFTKELCYMYGYDNDNNITMKRLPGRSTEHFIYDTNGRLSTYYDEDMLANGVTKQFSYDSLGRILGFRYVSAEGACCQQLYHYDNYNTDRAAEFVAVEGVVTLTDLSLSLQGKLTYERTFELYSSYASEQRECTYYYNNRGRCVQSITLYPIGIRCRTSIKYDYSGNPLKKVEEYSGSGGTFTVVTECSYDNRNRKLTESTSIDGSRLSSVTYTYDEQDRVIATTLNDSIRVSASYNLQGWMTIIEASRENATGLDRDIIFNESLRYYNVADQNSTPLYSGRIAEQDWENITELAQSNRYIYDYDPMGHLISTEHRIPVVEGSSSAGNYNEDISYDLNSNILSFRTSQDNTTQEENYRLCGNHITELQLNGIFNSPAEYDSRGNITRIPVENLQIIYNLLNLPQMITTTDGNTIRYSYLSDGSKFKAIHHGGNGYIYTGSLRWRLENGIITPESLPTAGGRVLFDGDYWTVNLYITDHIGSVRVVTDSTGGVLARLDYTPFGNVLNAFYSTPSTVDYRFTGKEWQGGLGANELYDSYARFLTTGGRFLSVDPLSEEYYHISPYIYCAGDPVNNVDPDGKKIKITGEQKKETLDLISELLDNELYFDDNDYVISGGPINANGRISRLISKIINDENIIVELRTINGKRTTNGMIFCGGAFMGSKTICEGTQKYVYTYQDINIDVLNEIDSYFGNKGRSLMHELTESYYGGIYALENKLEYVAPAFGVTNGTANEVYANAHNKAIRTATVYQKFLDKNGREVSGCLSFCKIIWYIEYNNRKFNIQTYP